jgi:hypothetical protein
VSILDDEQAAGVEGQGGIFGVRARADAAWRSVAPHLQTPDAFDRVVGILQPDRRSVRPEQLREEPQGALEHGGLIA